ncbi:MAG: hypothetical protein H7840_09405 [Alphaproteobacteria bacterium]
MPVLAVALGAILAVTGLLHLAAAVIALPARAVVSDIQAGNAVPDSIGLEAVAAIVRAAAWSADGELLSHASWLLHRAAYSAPEAGAAPALRAEAEARTRQALSLAPGQPTSWLRLAQLRRAEGDLEGAVSAFRMSLLTGAFTPPLMITRTTMGLDLMQRMDPETLALFERHVRQTWVVAPDFVDALRRQADSRAIAEAAVKGLTDDELSRAHRIHGRRPQ